MLKQYQIQIKIADFLSAFLLILLDRLEFSDTFNDSRHSFTVK